MFALRKLSVHYLKRTPSSPTHTTAAAAEDKLFLIVDDGWWSMGDAQANAAQQRKGLLESNKWILFMLSTGLMLFVMVWLMFFHVSGDGLYYPRDKYHNKSIPDQWLLRAIAYNSHTFDWFSNYTIIQPSAKTVLLDEANKSSNASGYKLVCYYNFPESNDSMRRLLASDLEPNLCTHLNVAFASVDASSRIHLSDAQLAVVAEIMAMKKVNPALKVLISVGGAGGDQGYARMVKDHENRKNFIKSILDYVKEYHFDGVDLDWEFPATNADPKTKQRMHFTQLLHEIRSEIARQTRYKFLLTVAVAAPVFIVDVAYDISYMNDYVDYVNVMSYDYHFYTKLTPFTGMNAPLYAREVDIGYFATLNINYTAHYWLSKGMQRDKIIVGLPTYGHSFRLINLYNHGLDAAANDYGNLGVYGFVGYNELCIFLRKNRISPMFDLTTRSPFATSNHEWVSFDDRQSLTYKTEYVKAHRFGGVMVYALNTDDHQGVCMENATSRFPLTKTIKYTLTTPGISTFQSYYY